MALGGFVGFCCILGVIVKKKKTKINKKPIFYVECCYVEVYIWHESVRVGENPKPWYNF